MPVPSDNPALRSHLESQLDFMNEFSKKSYDTWRQLSEMNLNLARQTIEGSLHSSRDMLGCTDPMQLAQTAFKQMQPAGERLRAYQQHLTTLLSGAQAALTQVAETRLPEVNRSAGAAAEEMVRHAAFGAHLPASGGEPAPPPPPPGNGSGSGDAKPRAS